MVSHWFSASQWQLPNEKKNEKRLSEKLQALFARGGRKRSISGVNWREAPPPAATNGEVYFTEPAVCGTTE